MEIQKLIGSLEFYLDAGFCVEELDAFLCFKSPGYRQSKAELDELRRKLSEAEEERSRLLLADRVGLLEENRLLARSAIRAVANVPEGEEKPLGVKELAKALGKSSKTIRRWEQKRLIPCRRIKYRKKYSLSFYLSEVKASLNKYKRHSL